MLSWLSLIFGIIGLVIAAVPSVFFTGALFLVPAFILGLVALALRSDRIWAAVVGVSAAALGGHVTVVSLVLVLVMFGSSIKLPGFDLSSVLKGFNLSALKLPKLDLPKFGGLGIPSAKNVAQLLNTVKKSSPKSGPSPSPSPTPKPKPGPTPTPAPEPTRVHTIGEVITNEDGFALMVYDVECGVTSVQTRSGSVTPDGQFCEAYFVLANTGTRTVTLDVAGIDAVIGSDDSGATQAASGFWAIDSDGTEARDEDISGDDNQIPDLNPRLELPVGASAMGIVNFDIDTETTPSYIHVQGDLFPEGILIEWVL